MAFDLVIRNGTVYDGSGGPPRLADVGVVEDLVVVVGDVDPQAEVGVELDAGGMAVAPGFVNMLSHSYISILQDARSLGELTQGVTTQIFGEAFSMGPLTPEVRAQLLADQRPLQFDVPWTTLSEYLAHVEKRGTSQNVASFIGARTLRQIGAGFEDRPMSTAEMGHVKGLVADEMADGALGIGSALIYPPSCFAPTGELIELCSVAARYRGKYISHLRSEGNRFLEALDEFFTIADRAGLAAEVYHLKAAGRSNWPKMDAALDAIEAAQAAGLAVTADVYTYTAGGTSLSATIPPRFHEGGLPALGERLSDAATLQEIRDLIALPGDDWENLYLASGGADGVLVLTTSRDEVRPYQGKTIAEIAAIEGWDDPIEALVELVRRDNRIGAAYFIIDEDNLRKALVKPWVSFGSDAASIPAEGAFLASATHPRSYGTFAKLLGQYVRDEKLVPLEEAVRRLSRLPADTLELDRRGRLEEGFFADVVVFDPDTIGDRATYVEPHQYSVGVHHVVVNGVVELRDGQFTGAFGGRALWGPGRRR